MQMELFTVYQKMIDELNKKKFLYKDFSIDVIPKFKNKIFCIHTNCFFTDIGDINNLNFLRQKKDTMFYKVFFILKIFPIQIKKNLLTNI